MSLPNQKLIATAANKYAAVRKQIERDRLLPWSSAVGIKIGSFTVAPLSFRSLVDLEIANNSFIIGDDPTPGDIAAYVWRHMPEYMPSADSKRFIKEIATASDVADLIEGIYNHMAGAFMETPAGAQFGGYARDNRLAAIPSIASICDEYGAAYGIDPQDVADIDLRIVFQCCRAQRLKNGEKYTEPQKLREAKREFLRNHGKN